MVKFVSFEGLSACTTPGSVAGCLCEGWRIKHWQGKKAPGKVMDQQPECDPRKINPTKATKPVYSKQGSKHTTYAVKARQKAGEMAR